MTQPTAAPPRQPLPGKPITPLPDPQWYTGPARLLLEEVPLHGRYTQHYGQDEAGYPVRELIWYGKREVTGVEVRNFIKNSMRFWLASSAAVDADGTVYYRQGDHHNAVMFVPDPQSGTVVNRPHHQIPEGAYLVTGPDDTPRPWRAFGLRQAVERALQPGPFDWPQGWALLMPDGAVRFAPCGTPWSQAVYTAQPAQEPEAWGPECIRCRRVATEHDPTRAWGGCSPKEMTTTA
ncbi:hypothetical protein [Streptomyces sp. NRRL B-24484]|uniref:hypothetical protein n=1 Tax=Streptomyces sp. NRRL B-24484 TaxID=1463833 RepID=UPI0004BEC6D6|nr:hypothetical protein [Streptomyces sp. NRRL B-24484]